MPTTSAARACQGFALVLLLAGCETTEEGKVALRFDELPLTTVTLTSKPDGSTIENHGADPAFIGRKEVGLQVGVFVPVTIDRIVLTYWWAGNRAGARSFERTANERLDPAPGPAALVYKFEIPGADKCQMCQALYYNFSANYRLSDGSPQTFVGPPHLVQPTKRLMPDGTVEQVRCGPPPGPNE
jgi:hypothetical protein